MKAPTINSKSGKYKFGLITQNINSWFFLILPTVLIDSTTAGIYDTVVVDLETGVYLSGEYLLSITGGFLNYTRFPGVVYDEFDFSNNAAHKWGDGTEIIGKDFDGDGHNDIGAGVLSYAMDLNGAFNNRPRIVEGINTTGSGFALMFDNSGQGTFLGSLAAGRGKNPYPIFDDDYHFFSSSDNTTTYALPGAAVGAKLQAVKGGHYGQVTYLSFASYFWAAGFDYDSTTQEWVYTGDHYSQIHSNSYYPTARFYELDMLQWLQLVRDVLSVPGFYDPSYKGMLFVHSTGNDGPGMQTITSTGAAELAVGSSAKYDFFQPSQGNPQGSDQIVAYTSKGPGNLGLMKPDVVAIGYIVASAAPSWFYFDNFATGNETFVWWSSTAVSAPYASGIAALVYQAYIETFGYAPTPDLVKSIIKSTAKDLGLNPSVQGCGQIDAYRAVQLARAQAGADGTPLVWTRTNTTFREVAKIINQITVQVWAESGDYPFYTSEWPGSENITHITEHPGLVHDFMDGSLYLGRIAQESSKTGSIYTTDGTGAGVDNVEAKQFKETTTVEFTVTTNSSFYYDESDIGYYYPFLLYNHLDSTQITAWQNAEFACVQVSLPLAESNVTERSIGWASIVDWHDDGDGIPEYANQTSGQIGEFMELCRYERTYVNTWDLQIGKPGSAFLTNNPLVLIRALNQNINATHFAGVELTIRVRMFTLVNWTDITITAIDGVAKKEWNITANVANDAIPGIHEGVILVTKENSTCRMPLSYMVTAAIPQGPDELVIGGEPTKIAYDNFAFYNPSFFDIIFDGSDLRSFSLSLDNENATYIAVNATWLYGDSEFNMFLYGPDFEIKGTSTFDFLGGTTPTQNYFFFDVSSIPTKTGIYTLCVESQSINLPPEILTLNIRYLTCTSTEFLTATAAWSAANNTVLIGPNAQLSVGWNQFSSHTELPDLSITGTRLSFLRGDKINETGTFGGPDRDFGTKYFYRTFEAGDIVDIRVGISPFGPDIDTSVYVDQTWTAPVLLYRMNMGWRVNPEVGQFIAPRTGQYTIQVRWFGYEGLEGYPSGDDVWTFYCYTYNHGFRSAESNITSLSVNTAIFNLDDNTYQVFAHVLTGTSHIYTQDRVFTLDNFFEPVV
ncbi:MAG: S8 family serine peptidase, partial [Candidatus Hodarchaeota archaeon]